MRLGHEGRFGLLAEIDAFFYANGNLSINASRSPIHYAFWRTPSVSQSVLTGSNVRRVIINAVCFCSKEQTDCRLGP